MVNSGKKYAQSVTGLVSEENLGITLPHEHLLIDMKVWHEEPAGAGDKKYINEKVGIKNLGWIKNNIYNNIDNMQLLDADVAIEEAGHFKNEGGGTIVDVTNVNLSRNPENLARISRATGLNIIMGSGYYVGESQTVEFDKLSVDDIAEEIINDIKSGVGIYKIKAGIIGEVGCSWPLLEREKKSLEASVYAQKETGAAITIHPGRHEDSPMEILEYMDLFGVDMNKVVMGHLDRTDFQYQTIKKIAKVGCYLEYDCFGEEGFYPLQLGVFNMPCDRERIEQVKKLIEDNFLDKIIISHDICMKMFLVSYGGAGYAHILKNIRPQMIAREIPLEQIMKIMVDNPKRFLCFA
jgi:phosphotriesterase-related protein